MNGIKECFVAFIDILGFRELVSQEDGTGNKLAVVKGAIEKATINLKAKKDQKNNPYNFWFAEFSVKSFSDCFCFSVPLEFDSGNKDYRQNLVAFYVWLKVFYNEMLAQGFLCRGGIAQGWHYVDENIIFSKAQIDACVTESQSATYPIIAIHQTLLGGINSQALIHTDYYQYMFAHDNAGRNFLHPFNYSIVDELFFGNRPTGPSKKDMEERRELLDLYLRILQDKLVKDSGSSFVDKSQWLKEFILYTKDGRYHDKFFSGLRF